MLGAQHLIYQTFSYILLPTVSFGLSTEISNIIFQETPCSGSNLEHHSVGISPQNFHAFPQTSRRAQYTEMSVQLAPKILTLPFFHFPHPKT